MHAPAQPQWLRAVFKVIPAPVFFRGIWSLFGGAIVLLAMRFLLVTQLKAEVVARVATDSTLAAHDSITNTDLSNVKQSLDTIRTNQKINIRAVCLDHTKGQQALIGVNCPPYLYRGAQ